MAWTESQIALVISSGALCLSGTGVFVSYKSYKLASWKNRGEKHAQWIAEAQGLDAMNMLTPETMKALPRKYGYGAKIIYPTLFVRFLAIHKNIEQAAQSAEDSTEKIATLSERIWNWHWKKLLRNKKSFWAKEMHTNAAASNEAAVSRGTTQF